MSATTTQWVKSSYSDGANGGCVATRWHEGLREIRDTKLGEKSPILSFEPAAFVALIEGIKDGELRRPGA